MKPTKEEIQTNKEQARRALLIVKKWIINDLEHSDPEEMVHDIQWLLEDL